MRSVSSGLRILAFTFENTGEKTGRDIEKGVWNKNVLKKYA